MTEVLQRRARWFVACVATAILAAGRLCAQDADTDAATKQFIAANGLFQRNLPKLAADEYERFLRQYPQHANATMARYALAVCRLRLSEFDKAAAGFEQVLKAPKFAQGEDALFMLAHSYLGLRQYDRATAAFDRLLTEFPKGGRAESAALNRAQALYLMGKPTESAGACENFLTSYPTSVQRPEGLYFLGLAQHAAGRDPQAIEALQKMLGAQPDSPRKWDAVLLLGQMLEAGKNYDSASAEYQKLIDSKLPDRSAEGLLSLAVLQYRRTAYEDSIQTLSRLLSEQPESANAPAARLQLALAQLAADRIADARATLAAIVEKHPARAGTARYWLAQCDIIEKKFDKALATLDELGKTPAASANADRITFDRAQCLMGLGKFPEAAVAYAAFLDKYPAHAQAPEATFYQAFCLHKSQHYGKSEALCRRLVADPAGRFANSAKELLAENLFLLARYDEALAVFEQLQAAGIGDKLRLTVRLGQCAYFQGKPDRAIELLSPVASDPKLLADRELARSLLLLGDALLNSGKSKDAAAALTRFIPVAQADKPEALFKLGLAQVRVGDDIAAERTFAEVMREQADSIWKLRATFEYGQLAYRNRDANKASAALKQVALAKENPELAGAAQYLLAWIELDAHRFESAAGQFAALAKEFPKHALAADAIFHAGLSLRQAGSDEQAVETLRQYLLAQPAGANAQKARQLIAASLVKLQKHDEARKSLLLLAADPKTVSDEVLYDLAWSQEALKDDASAEQTYRRLLTDYPKSKLAASAKSELGELLFRRADYEKASHLLRDVVADKTGEPKTVSVALYRLGSCYEKLNRPADATQMYTDFLASHKDDELAAWAHYQAGVNLARQRKWADAKTHFQQALGGKAKGELAAVSLLRLGEMQAELGEFDASEATYRQFIEKFPKDKMIRSAQFGVGWAMENRKSYEAARQWYQKVVAATNSELAARAQFQTGETYFAQGKYEDAIKSLLAVADVYGYPKWSARAVLEAGRAFEQLKQPKEAIEQYRQVVSKYKDTPEAALAAKRLAALRAN